jgi:hypothetical protein
MKRKYLSALLASLALVAIGVFSVGSASAATLKEEVSGTAFQAVYGNPGTNEATLPVGGGLGRNFGFGANMLFCASTVTAANCKNSQNLTITIGGAVLEAKQTYLGGTLTSNKTGENVPLSFAIEFADFQNAVTGATAVPTFADTFDRPWISEICAPASVAGKCKTDPLFSTPAGSVKIEDVSLEVVLEGKPNIIQGTAWGIWEQGTSTVPPCIKLTAPPTGATASQTLTGTQGALLGASITAAGGRACLISADNYYYSGKEPAIILENK